MTGIRKEECKRARNSGYTDRSCLCCKNIFRSQGPHNRLCKVCRRKEGDEPTARIAL